MRRFQWFVVIAVSILGSAMLVHAAPQAPAGQSGPVFTPVASVLELMQEMVDPIGDALFESVSVVITAQGSKETKPRTDAEWFKVRNDAIQLAEAGNLRPAVDILLDWVAYSGCQGLTARFDALFGSPRHGGTPKP